MGGLSPWLGIHLHSRCTSLHKTAYQHAWANVYTKLLLMWVKLIVIILYSHKSFYKRNYTWQTKQEDTEYQFAFWDWQSDFYLIAGDTFFCNEMQLTSVLPRFSSHVRTNAEPMCVSPLQYTCFFLLLYSRHFLFVWGVTP